MHLSRGGQLCRSLPLLWLWLVMLPMAPIGAQIPEPAPDQAPQPEDSIQVTRDDQQGQVTISVPLDDGRLEWADVARGLARAADLDDSALDGLLPRESVDIDRTGFRLALATVGLVTGGGLRVESATEDRLTLVVDRHALRQLRSYAKDQLRRLVTPDEGVDERRYRLDLDDGWQDAPAEKPLVIVVHGFQSNPRRLLGIRQLARSQTLPTGTVAYPNDDGLLATARRFSKVLHGVREQQPERPVILIAHSMGGLVARRVIEDPELDPGNVARLIMIFPPNHGSRLALLGTVSDFWEHLAIIADEPQLFWPQAAIEDGLGEAQHDLDLGSPFLTDLNARKRNAQVRYSIVLGTRGPITQQQLDRLRQTIARNGQRHRLFQLFGPKLDEMLTDLDEVVHGLGDGAVAIKRGRLEGVDDVVLLDLDHGAVNASNAEALDPELRQAILQRLASEGSDGARRGGRRG